MSSIPVKLGIGKTVLPVVVDKVVFCGLKARQPIVGCYPDTSFIIFQDTADTVVWQAMKGVVTDKLFFSIFVLHTFINAITVAAQPQCAVLSFVKATYLFYQSGRRIIQFVLQMTVTECSLRQ